MRFHRSLLLSFLAVSFLVSSAPSGASPPLLTGRVEQVEQALQVWLESGGINELNLPELMRGAVLDLPEPGEPMPPGEEPSLRLLVVTSNFTKLMDAGFSIGTMAGGVATVIAPLSRVHELEELAGVIRVELPMPLEPLLDVSRPEINAGLVHGSPKPPYPGATGEGVVVGIVDTGIDITHEDFRNADGTSRVSRIWDQTDNGGPSPAGFGYGTEWTSADINAGIIRQRDTDGHGTHVSGIAAGNGRSTAGQVPEFQYSGIAPEAEIIFVKTDFLTDSIIDAVNWIQIHTGVKPSVVNLSLGSQFGPHDGTSSLDLALAGLSGPGKIIVASAGNDGEQDIHAEAQILGGGGTEEIELDLNPFTPSPGANNDLVFLDGWYDGGASFLVTVLTPTNIQIGPVGPGLVASRTTADGTVRIEQFVGTNGDNAIFLDLWDSNGIPPRSGRWRVRVENTGPSSSEVDFWVSFNRLGSSFTWVRWHNFVDEAELIATPASSPGVIAVGAYVTKTSWPVFGGGTCAYQLPLTIGAIAPFSSPGPLRNDGLKPEISAPGMGIASAFSVTASNPTLTHGCARAPTNVHVVTQGTSQSAPHITGTVALILENAPTASYQEVASQLTGTARHDAFTGPGFSTLFGYGKVDAFAAAGVSGPIVAMDIHPTSCPNPFGVNKQGVIPVALLGTEHFDVHEIDVTTLLLQGVPPKKTGYEDVAGSFEGEQCDCTEEGPDGFEDLTLKFKAPPILETLLPVIKGEVRVLTLTGNLLNGTPFEASDCMVMRGTVKDEEARAPGAKPDPDPDPDPGTDPGVEVDETGAATFGIVETDSPRGTQQRISYGLSEASDARITLFDISGRVVRRLHGVSGSPGHHTLTWNGAGLASGIYFYRLESGSLVATRKVTIVH